MNQPTLIPMPAGPALKATRKPVSAPAKRYAELMEEAATYVAECKPVVTSPEHVAHLIRPLMLGEMQERLWCITLDPKNCVTNMHQLTVGLADRSQVSCPVVLRYVLMTGALRFILVHNHPSGCPVASPPDISVTKDLQAGAKIVGLELVDHIIVGEPGTPRCPEGHYSLREYGHLK
jgi:DNA repair protein RadC